MSEDGFNRQLKMAISLLNNWRDFLKLNVPMYASLYVIDFLSTLSSLEDMVVMHF
jgi:hypothetical protein